MWQTEGPPIYNNTQAARRFAYDNTGVRSLPKFASILHRIMTPDNQRYQRLTASEPSLMKSHDVRMFFDRLTDEVFKRRMNPRARFTQAQNEVYTSIGLYGTGPKSITWRKPNALDGEGGFGYKAWPLKDVFLLVDDEGNVVMIFRRFWLNVRQFRMKFKGEQMPRCMATEAQKPVPSESIYFEFVQLLELKDKDQHDPQAMDYRRFPICNSYICVTDKEYVGEEDGFLSWPMTAARSATEPGDIYGYSVAQVALPAMGGVSAMKKTVLKQGQKAVDPPILAADDGVLSGRVDMRPSKVNYGGISASGQKLIGTMDNVGSFQVAEKLLEGERADVEDSFFVTVFQILSESSEMTATEVMERIAQQAALLAPMMGRLQSEDLGPTTEREIALLAEKGILTDKYGLQVPDELVEARGQYNIMYSSPMAKGQYAEDVSGFMRWLEMNLNYAEATKDPSCLDWVNMDDANPEIAEVLSVRTGWVNSQTKVTEVRAKRESQQQTQQVVDQAPAIASVVNTAMKQKGSSNPPGVSNA